MFVLFKVCFEQNSHHLFDLLKGFISTTLMRVDREFDDLEMKLALRKAVQTRKKI